MSSRGATASVTGRRDLLGPEVPRRREVARRALAAFARYGYEQAITPAFEREDVLLRASPERDGGDLVRFLDPDTAEVLALRSDMTPQVARIVATRTGAPLPARISYEGSVLRRARGRSSQRRQLAQAGVECVGWSSPEADLEVLRVTLEALRDNGIGEVVVELSHAAPLRQALARVPPALRDAVADGLARKDRAAWRHPLGDHAEAREEGVIATAAGHRRCRAADEDLKAGARVVGPPAQLSEVGEHRAREARSPQPARGPSELRELRERGVVQQRTERLARGDGDLLGVAG